MTAEEMMRDHWWWRPGWRSGRRMYTWHVTFEGQSSLHRLVADYQSVLNPLSGLDLVPPRWLHLTMQGVGFIDETAEDDARSIVDAARKRCANISPFELSFGAPKVDPEAIMFALSPSEPAQAVRAQIRGAIADVWGVGNVNEPDEWQPHVSIAYSNTSGPTAQYVEALSHVTTTPANLVVASVELIVLNRDNRMYEWQTFAAVPLGGEAI
jgi:2'-5' RNA ligase